MTYVVFLTDGYEGCSIVGAWTDYGEAEDAWKKEKARPRLNDTVYLMRFEGYESENILTAPKWDRPRWAAAVSREEE